jgi:acyl-CoA thioesterase I
MRTSATVFQVSRATAISVGVCLLALSATGRARDAPLLKVQQSPDPLSSQCRVPGDLLYRLAPLRRVRSAIEQKHALRVLALGPTSASVVGQGTGLAPFSVRLEHELEKVLPGVDVTVEARSLPGELTAEASSGIMNIVSEVEPELIVWQVGISDALAQADVAAFSEALAGVLTFLRAHHIDAVLVEPPYTAALASDDHFKDLVAAISERARENQVVLIRRSAAMRFLFEQRSDPPQSRFDLQKLGYHCTAEHVGYVVRLSTNRADAENGGFRAQ